MGTWHKVAKVSDVSEDCGHLVTVGEQEIALVSFEDTMYAVEDMCSHAEASLCDGMVDGCEIECPLHFARFDVRTGEATAPPATESIKTFPVRIDGDDIEVEIAD